MGAAESAGESLEDGEVPRKAEPSRSYDEGNGPSIHRPASEDDRRKVYGWMVRISTKKSRIMSVAGPIAESLPPGAVGEY